MIISAGAENTFDKNSTFKEKKLRNKKNKSQLEKGILMLLSLMISEMSSPLPSTDTYMVSIPFV